MENLLNKMEKVKEHFTKYETARILGARALQLSMNAPMLLSVPKEQLEEVNFDPLKIAEIEFKAGVLPITVKRPLPERVEEEYEEDEEELSEEILPEETGKAKKNAIEKESAEIESERASESTE